MKPLILDYKISRTENNNPIIYSYSYETSMNMILIKDRYKPFIDVNCFDLEFQTKTRMHRENDDDQFFQTFGTETKVARETSDNTNDLIELVTKTFVKRERDDENSFNY